MAEMTPERQAELIVVTTERVLLRHLESMEPLRTLMQQASALFPSTMTPQGWVLSPTIIDRVRKLEEQMAELISKVNYY
jgi:hypothetical protein